MTKYMWEWLVIFLILSSLTYSSLKIHDKTFFHYTSFKISIAQTLYHAIHNATQNGWAASRSFRLWCSSNSSEVSIAAGWGLSRQARRVNCCLLLHLYTGEANPGRAPRCHKVQYMIGQFVYKRRTMSWWRTLLKKLKINGETSLQRTCQRQQS